MTYELAKQLKHARFPQLKPGIMHGQYLIAPDAIITRTDSDIVDRIDRSRDVYEPTLSELIEALGRNFIGLLRQHDGWSANSDSDTAWHVEGSTPEEAAAKLWLALNVEISGV